MIQPSSVVALIAALPACGGGDGAPDAAPQLPDPEAYLPAARYDCSAAGPFLAPARPHAAGCFADPACASRLVVGHRMANPFAPENSLSALRAAILLGADIVETDIRLTGDGQVVLIHDSDVNRTTAGIGAVGEHTLAELRALPLELEGGDPAGDFSCDVIPTMEEALALAEGQIVVELEVKESAAGVAAAEHLRDQGLYGRAFLLCDPDECAAARAAVADVPIMTRPQDAGEVTAALAFDPAPIMVHIDALDGFLEPAVVEQIHAAGAKVYANGFIQGDGPALASGDLDAYVRLYDDGLDVVQAEYPHFALQALGRLAAPDGTP